MPPCHNCFHFGLIIESVYTLLILIMSFLIFFKTKELYGLTKHNGIKYFRIGFLFFGIAYIFRFLMYLIMFSDIALDPSLPGDHMSPFFFPLVSYFSTMALFYLTYSKLWKRINANHFLLFSNLLALVLSVISFIFRSPLIMVALQLILLLIAIFVGNKGKHFSKMRVLYLLIFVFWILNFFALEPARMVTLESRGIMELISLLVFWVLFYRVLKWVK